MGAPKGKPHRKFTPEEKLRYITELQESHISQSKFAKEHGINISILKRWMKDYVHTAVASGSWCGAERQQRGDSGSVLI